MSIRTLRISHTEEEALLGATLRMFLTGDATGLQIRLTGTPTSGQDRAAAINDQLHSADVMLVLCSEQSVQQPWLAFEAGSGWRQPGLVMIPICHSGMEQPPEPFGLFACLVAESPTFVKDLASAISRATGKPATLDQLGMREALDAALEQLAATSVTARTQQAGEKVPGEQPDSEPADDGELDEQHVALLKQLAITPETLMPLAWLSNSTGQRQADALIRMRRLCDRSLASELRRRTAVPRFRVTEQGLTFLRDAK
ncbi:MAG: hypothetical protein ACI8UD_000999 [Planctomycetota bacterium]|jgi:hypothetical protein